MASFTMNEHEYFKAIEENTIVQIYCCEFCYVIRPNLDSLSPVTVVLCHKQ